MNDQKDIKEISEKINIEITVRNDINLQTNSKNIFSYYFPNYEKTQKENNFKNEIKEITEKNTENNEQFIPQNISESSSPTSSDSQPKARYFIVKSIDEDNIHKSIKYKTWCSTPRGNQKLTQAFSEAKGAYPLYLFFSVNGSGRFIGVAQMISELDTKTNFNYWSQSDKWKGFFFVSWLIIKDLPNKAFKHLLNEYNENRPVTSSRDTQEIYPTAGSEMLQIFENYISDSSILDDFEFYEKKQGQYQKSEH